MTNTSPFEESPTQNEQEEEQPNELVLDLDTYQGRIAARAYAYAMIAFGDKELGVALLDEVGREG